MILSVGSVAQCPAPHRAPARLVLVGRISGVSCPCRAAAGQRQWKASGRTTGKAGCRAQRQQPRKAEWRTAASEEDAVEASTSEEEPVEGGTPTLESLLQKAKQALAEGDAPAADQLLEQAGAEAAALAESAAAASSQAVAVRIELEAEQAAYLRLTADFENFRMRTAGEKEAIAGRVKGEVVSQLLPLVDSFEMAKGQLKAETDGEKKIETSYQGLYKQLVESFRGLGVEAVPGVGHTFDPAVHDAIMREESDEVPDGTVLKEFRRGFRLGDRLLRASMVQVSFSNKAPEAPENGSAEPGAEAIAPELSGAEA